MLGVEIVIDEPTFLAMLEGVKAVHTGGLGFIWSGVSLARQNNGSEIS